MWKEGLFITGLILSGAPAVAQEQGDGRAVNHEVNPAVQATKDGMVIATTEPLIDVTKNPGCGEVAYSPEAKVDRNRRLALYYFQASVEESERKFKYTLASQGCTPRSGKSTWLYGSFTPPPARATIVEAKASKGGEDFVQRESRAWRSVFPDMGAVPGTLRVLPNEDGVFFTFKYAGTTKSGQKIDFWEIVNMLVSDQGEIYHYECWNDTAGMEKAFQIAFGRSFKGMSLPEYFGLIESKLTKGSAK